MNLVHAPDEDDLHVATSFFVPYLDLARLFLR